jgi:hypothetical protein
MHFFLRTYLETKKDILENTTLQILLKLSNIEFVGLGAHSI